MCEAAHEGLAREDDEHLELQVAEAALEARVVLEGIDLDLLEVRDVEQSG